MKKKPQQKTSGNTPITDGLANAIRKTWLLAQSIDCKVSDTQKEGIERTQHDE